MATYQYRINSQTLWQASSGNAILAFYNTTGSGKKISIRSIEVANNTRLGMTTTATTTAAASTFTQDLNFPAPQSIYVSPVTSTAGGTTLTPIKMDSQATWPTAVSVTTNSSFNWTWKTYGSNISMSAVAAGLTVFTASSQAGSAAPTWVANEFLVGGRYLQMTVGPDSTTSQTGNPYFRILTNTAAGAATLDRPMSSTASGVSAFIVEPLSYIQGSIQKQLRSDTTGGPMVQNFGQFNRKDVSTGGLFDASMNTNSQEITIRAGEEIAVWTDAPNSALPLYVSADVIVQGTPNRTFTFDFFTYLNADRTSIFSIKNAAGSGQILTLENIDVSEVGTMDTCYLQVVPVGTINSSTFNDSNRELTTTAVRTDSNSPALTTSTCRIFTNSPILPYGVPVAYVADGSASATPKGYNYLNTKDFIGPQFMAYFPEAAAFKPRYLVGGTTVPFSTGVVGQMGANINNKLSTIKGDSFSPIVLREGEGFAITSGAETAAGATVDKVGVSGWQSFDFAITFAVEPSRIPTLSLSGMVAGSRYEVLTYSSAPDSGTILFSGTAAAGNTVSTASWSGNLATFTTPTDHGYIAGQSVTITGITPTGYNGTFTIYDVPTTTTFRVILTTNPGSYTSGGAIAVGQLNLTFTTDVPIAIKIRVRKAGASPKYLPYELVTTMTSSDLTIPVSQIVDTIA